MIYNSSIWNEDSNVNIFELVTKYSLEVVDGWHLCEISHNAHCLDVWVDIFDFLLNFSLYFVALRSVNNANIETLSRQVSAIRKSNSTCSSSDHSP